MIELSDLYNSGTLAFGHNQDQLVQLFRTRSNYGEKKSIRERQREKEGGKENLRLKLQFYKPASILYFPIYMKYFFLLEPLVESLYYHFEACFHIRFDDFLEIITAN